MPGRHHAQLEHRGRPKAGLEFRDDRPFPVLTPEHAVEPIHKMSWIWAFGAVPDPPDPGRSEGARQCAVTQRATTPVRAKTHTERR